MKTEKTKKKLFLNRSTIANLNYHEMKIIYGGRKLWCICTTSCDPDLTRVKNCESETTIRDPDPDSNGTCRD